MSEEMKFFIYLTECYANYRNERTGDILSEWERCGILKKIYENYWVYHTERIENAYMDIDSMIETGKPAW